MSLTDAEREGWSTGYEVPWQHIVVPALAAMGDHEGVADYSRFIYRTQDFLEAAGVVVEPFAFDLPDHVGGRAQYEPVPTVWINEPGAREALLTFAHEAGHLVSYWRHRKAQPDPPSTNIRERYAFLYGWVVLRWIGAAPGLVTKAEWVAFDEHR